MKIKDFLVAVDKLRNENELDEEKSLLVVYPAVGDCPTDTFAVSDIGLNRFGAICVFVKNQ